MFALNRWNARFPGNEFHIGEFGDIQGSFIRQKEPCMRPVPHPGDSARSTPGGTAQQWSRRPGNPQREMVGYPPEVTCCKGPETAPLSPRYHPPRQLRWRGIGGPQGVDCPVGRKLV
jgi:hypothetical protein